MNLSDKVCKLRLLTGEEVEFNLLTAESADIIYSILTNKDSVDYVEQTFNIVTKNRYNIDDFQAGIVLLAIYTCILKSGVIRSPDSLVELIENARNDIGNNIYFSIFMHIVSYLPTYKLSDLREMTTNELFEVFAFAEKVSGKQLFDIEKIKTTISNASNTKPKAKKGTADITQDEISLLQSIINSDELKFDGMPAR